MSDPVAKRPKMDGGSVNEVQRRSKPPKETCNLTTQTFHEIIGVKAFVDKTLFIKAFLEAEDHMVVILAPRRFGKSTNMDMVKEFVTGNKEPFEGNQLKIWKEEREFFDAYCQKNPVIHVDFKHVNVGTVDNLLRSFRELILDAFKEHRYLINGVRGNYSWSVEKLERICPIDRFEMYWNNENLSEVDIIHGLRKLSECLNVYHDKPVYAFIDEYDAPVMDAILNTSPEDGVLEATIKLIRAMMSSFLKGNKHVTRGLINACVRIAQVFSKDANNIKHHAFLGSPEFFPYFGFTDKEVNSLFEKDEFVTLKSDEVANWYNGYKLMNIDEYVICSSYSILEYLQQSKKYNKPMFKSYWVDTGSITYLKELFAETQIRILIENLIDGEEVEIVSISKFSREDIITLQNMVHKKIHVIDIEEAYLFLQFLAENGYLNVVSTKDNKSTLLAPNNEIKKLLREKCYSAQLYRNKYQLSPQKIREYVGALSSLLHQRDKKAFIRFAKAVSGLFDGAVMPKCEDEFHCILFTLAYNFKMFGVSSELSVQQTKNRGRPNHLDLLVIFNEVGIILELKFEVQSSKEAYDQIQERGYPTAFNYYKDVAVKILLGVHMTKERKVSLTYTVDNSAKQTVTSNDQTTDGLQVFSEQHKRRRRRR